MKGLWVGALAALALALSAGEGQAADWRPGFADLVAGVKQSVVAVGTYQQMRRPPAKIMGTGFVVVDGNHVITNAHVLPGLLDEAKREFLAVFLPADQNVKARPARVVKVDDEHDLALLEIADKPLPALTLGDSERVREGELYAFTGFPMGAVLGLRPVTHRGLISALTPLVMPADSDRQLNPKMIHRMLSPYEVFQLDATAYPGNSGSPLYDPDSGAVVGVINSVFVKETKESVLQKPSGVSYAIPIRYAHALIKEAGLTGK